MLHYELFIFLSLCDHALFVLSGFSGVIFAHSRLTSREYVMMNIEHFLREGEGVAWQPAPT